MIIISSVKRIKGKSINSRSNIQLLWSDTVCYIINFVKENILCLKILGYKFIDLCVIDLLTVINRFVSLYMYIEPLSNNRFLIMDRFSVDEGIESITEYFVGAATVEREMFDMFGCIFKKNKDLRRILTDYGFRCNPLKKDFPLSGYKQIKYSAWRKALRYEPIYLAQELREHIYIQPWKVYN